MTNLNGYTDHEHARAATRIKTDIANLTASQAARVMKAVLRPSLFDSLMESIASACCCWKPEIARLSASDIDAITRIVTQSMVDNILELSYVETTHAMMCPNCGDTMPMSKWMSVEIGGGPHTGPMDNAIAPDNYAGCIHCGRATLADNWEEVQTCDRCNMVVEGNRHICGGDDLDGVLPADSQAELVQFMTGVKR